MFRRSIASFQSVGKKAPVQASAQGFDAIYKSSIDPVYGGSNPEFWAEAAKEIDWFTPFHTPIDRSQAPHQYKWFVGGQLNTCYNALDRHVLKGSAEASRVALHYDSPITGTPSQHITYKDLLDQVQRLAGVLYGLGVRKGDRVVLYMPMTPESIVSMLAVQRLGAIHSVVFDGFASHELAKRINDAKPKVIISANYGVEPQHKIINLRQLLNHAIELSEPDARPRHCLILQRTVEPSVKLSDPAFAVDTKNGRDLDYYTEMDRAKPFRECVPVEANDPAYILYTSGSTGKPKGVVRPSGGHAVCLKWSMKNFFDIEAGDTMATFSSTGWVVGHSYIVYGPMLQGATSILLEGKPVGTPDASTLWRCVDEYGAKTMFTAPTALRAIKRDDPDGQFFKKYPMKNLKHLFVAGERSDIPTLQWLDSHVNARRTETNKVEIIDNWWQTETGFPISGKCTAIDPKCEVVYGSANKPVPGYDVQVKPLHEDANHEVSKEDSHIGNIVIAMPMPPCVLSTLWNDQPRFESGYLREYPGYYLTGDSGYIDEKGCVHIMSRTDDIINVAAHRLSTAEMEEALLMSKDVVECAVVGIADEIKGEVPIGFVVLSKKCTKPVEQVKSELVKLVREEIGGIACFKQVLVVDKLPKTRSGKTLRATMRKISEGQQYAFPATIEDPDVLQIIEKAVKEQLHH